MAPSLPLTILAIDPGYDRLGWAVGQFQGNHIQVVEFGCLQPEKSLSLWERYGYLDTQVSALIAKYHPSTMVLESVFYFKNIKTVLKVSEVRGILISCALRSQLAIAEYTPLQIKQAVTGYGRADKAAVKKMIALQLKLDLKNVIDDAVDALAILLTHTSSAAWGKCV